MEFTDITQFKHDAYFKREMSDVRLAKEFFAAHVPQSIAQYIDFDQLQLQSEEFIGDALGRLRGDILYRTVTKDGHAPLYLLAEHQSTPDRLMPLRLLCYSTAIMKKHLAQSESQVLPVVIPIVVYNGAAPYNHSLDLFQLFGNHGELARNCLFGPYQLIDLSCIPDEDILRRSYSGMLEYALKHVFAKDLTKPIKNLVELFESVQTLLGNDLIIDTVTYLLGTASAEQADQVLSIIRGSCLSQSGDQLMTIAEYLIEKGEKAGMERGMHKGQYTGQALVVKRMLAKGFDINLISEMTTLSKAEIAALQ